MGQGVRKMRRGGIDIPGSWGMSGSWARWSTKRSWSFNVRWTGDASSHHLEARQCQKILAAGAGPSSKCRFAMEDLTSSIVVFTLNIRQWLYISMHWNLNRKTCVACLSKLAQESSQIPSLQNRQRIQNGEYGHWKQKVSRMLLRDGRTSRTKQRVNNTRWLGSSITFSPFHLIGLLYSFHLVSFFFLCSVPSKNVWLDIRCKWVVDAFSG